jgi:glutamate synthase (NADPH/NADH) small chain
VLTGALEAFVTEFQRQEQGVTIPVAASTGRKVAVIGAGPAGLSCAEQLVRRGHWVTVYDAMPLPGGMMISTIPNFRLPKQLIQGIWGDLERAGVTFMGNTYIGRKKTVDDLIREGYEAVFIGIGAGLQARLGLPGEDLAEVFQVNQFLMRVNAPLEFLPEGERQRPTIGRRVVVIGGGDPATDCARSAIRLGAEEVVCLFNQTEKELPGRLEDRQLASEEGVTFHLQVQPVRFIAGETGKLAQIECVRTRPGPPDQPGAPSIRAVRRSNFFIEADTAIVAAGYSPDPIIAATTPGLKAHKWGLIIADQETGATSRFGIFTGGDVVTGPDLVVTAMVAGRKAANNIDAYLG